MLDAPPLLGILCVCRVKKLLTLLSLVIPHQHSSPLLIPFSIPLGTVIGFPWLWRNSAAAALCGRVINYIRERSLLVAVGCCEGGRIVVVVIIEYHQPGEHQNQCQS